jgi:hypothetical protein
LFFLVFGRQRLDSVKETEDLATSVLSACLFVIDDAGRRGEHHKAELPGWEQVVDPLLNVLDRDVKPWADHTTLHMQENATVRMQRLERSYTDNRTDIVQYTWNQKDQRSIQIHSVHSREGYRNATSTDRTTNTACTHTGLGRRISEGTHLVEAAVEVDHNLACSVVVHNLELTNVTCDKK